MQHQEQDAKIKNLRAFLVSPAVYTTHEIDDVTAALNLISRIVANSKATHEFLQIVQDHHVEALGRPKIENGIVVIDYAL